MLVLSLVLQPIAFFRTRLSQPPSWRFALGGPLGCVGLALVSQALFSEKVTAPVFDALGGLGVSPAFATSLRYMSLVNAAFIHVIVWLLASAFLIAVDVLVVGSDRLTRVLEANAIAFYSQWPWLVVLVGLAVVFQPPSLQGQDGAFSLADLERLQRLLRQDPLLASVGALNECFAAWLYGLFGAAFHVTTGLAIGKSLGLTLSMFTAFHLLRYVP